MAVEYGVNVSLTNEDKGYVFSEWSEPLGDFLLKDDGTPDMGKVYREALSEYGRPTSSVYVDNVKTGKPMKIGWFFVSRQQYERSDETYLRGAWVTVGQKDSEE